MKCGMTFSIFSSLFLLYSPAFCILPFWVLIIMFYNATFINKHNIDIVLSYETNYSAGSFSQLPLLATKCKSLIQALSCGCHSINRIEWTTLALHSRFFKLFWIHYINNIRSIRSNRFRISFTCWSLRKWIADDNLTQNQCTILKLRLFLFL